MTFTESIRLVELDLIIDEIEKEARPGKHILEIGGGAGWQAKKLSERGFVVASIDIPESIYSGMKVWPIAEYDGKHIPFPDGHFDFIFSSSALEHIPHLSQFGKEMERVLKVNGVALHIVPSGTWRLWTNVAHYPFLLKFLLKGFWKTVSGGTPCATNLNEMEELALLRKSQMSMWQIMMRAVVPARHGEKGSALTEIFYFSRHYWLKSFKASGCRVERVFSNKLMYSGHMICGPLIPILWRRELSSVLGSSCHIFKLRKVGAVRQEKEDLLQS